ncbi:hypothetical protein HUU53_02110 [Candidatus Micrarchaeota archaeon]|nr:hypothetical protein [Candidatus Micrarchaeota archaeon]
MAMKNGPSIQFQIMSLAEDAGLVKYYNRGSSFEDAMSRLAFILPDEVVHAIALASGVYALLTLGII